MWFTDIATRGGGPIPDGTPPPTAPRTPSLGWSELDASPLEEGAQPLPLPRDLGMLDANHASFHDFEVLFTSVGVMLGTHPELVGE